MPGAWKSRKAGVKAKGRNGKSAGKGGKGPGGGRFGGRKLGSFERMMRGGGRG